MSDAHHAIKTKSSIRRLAAGNSGLRMSKRCSARTRSGERCKAAPLHGTNKCAFHSGNNASVCGQRGGRRRAIFNPDNLEPMKAPRDAAELRAMLSQTLVEVRSARLDTRTATAISCLATSFLKATEIADLDTRLRNLEDRYAAREKARIGRPSGQEPHV